MRIILCLLLLSGAPAFAASAASVTLHPLEQVAIHPVREAPAQAVSLNFSRLSAELAARIERIPVEPGQRITRGTVVATLDCGDASIAVRRAEATLASATARMRLARQQLARNSELAAKQFISGDALDSRKGELEIAEAELQLNQAALDAARRDMAKCTVRAPFPAIVEERLAQEGEWANPGTPLVRVWDTSRIQLVAQLQAQDAETLARAHPGFVCLGRDYRVKLLRVSPAMNPAARTREARLTFTGTSPAPGSSGVLRWHDPRPWLPHDYLVRYDGKLGVFVERAGVARFVALPGAQEGRPALADSLPRDVRLVGDGRFALHDGMKLAPR